MVESKLSRLLLKHLWNLNVDFDWLTNQMIVTNLFHLYKVELRLKFLEKVVQNLRSLQLKIAFQFGMDHRGAKEQLKYLKMNV